MHTRTLPFLLTCTILLIGCATGSPTPNGVETAARDLVEEGPAPVENDELQAALERFLTPPPEVRDYLDRKIRPIKSEEERYRALRKWAFKEFQSQYVYDPGFTAPLSQLDAAGRINCFSFSNMFVAAARYVDLPASFQLVDSPPQWNMNSDTFVVSQHINVTGMLRRRLAENEKAVLRNERARATGTRIQKVNWDKLNRSYVVDLNPSIAVDSYRSRTINDREALALYYSNRSVELLLAENEEQALVYGQQAVLTDKQSVTAWSNLGVILSRMGKTDTARQAYLAALSLDGDAETAASNLERLYRRTGEVRKANELAAQTASRRKRNPYYHYAMGAALLEQGEPGQALEHLKDAISRKGDERLFYYALASAQIQLGDFDRAMRNLEQAREYSSSTDLWRYEELSSELQSASHSG
ncbi:MAG: tetratricopeptide repeat protein [Halieaceae bacterium]|jgi:Flp pilus assembly protein TadD|nr:tetratricopeptide repeat protein [Halieaceae bacterium]